jgi:hypothetical protein
VLVVTSLGELVDRIDACWTLEPGGAGRGLSPT